MHVGLARSSCPRRARSACAAPGPARHAQRERRVGLLDAQVHVLAAELQAAVAQQRAGQQPGLEQDLEAVADAEHRPAARRRTPAPRRMIGENRAMAPVRR